MWVAVIWMFFVNAHAHKVRVRSLSTGDRMDPKLFMQCMAFVLSVLIAIDMCESLAAKHCVARRMAFSSEAFIWRRASVRFHVAPVARLF